MVYNINGRDYQSYQLSNKQVIELYKNDKLTDEQRKELEDLMVSQFEHDLCPRAGEDEDDVFARFFSNFVNGRLKSRKHVAEKLSNEHRYLQQEMFRVCLSYIEKLADNYEKGWYDPRNKYACKTSSAIIESLKEKQIPF